VNGGKCDGATAVVPASLNDVKGVAAVVPAWLNGVKDGAAIVPASHNGVKDGAAVVPASLNDVKDSAAVMDGAAVVPALLNGVKGVAAVVPASLNVAKAVAAAAPAVLNGVKIVAAVAPASLNGTKGGAAAVPAVLNGIKGGAAVVPAVLNGVKSVAAVVPASLNGAKAVAAVMPASLNGTKAVAAVAPASLKGVQAVAAVVPASRNGTKGSAAVVPVLSGAAAVVPASPNVADSHQLDGARLVDRSSGVLHGVISLAPEYVADTAMQIGGRPHHLFIPIILSDDGSFLGVPGGVESGCFGAERNFSTRGADFDQAERFAAQLFPRRHDIHAFYMYELESPSVVVSGAVISDPPPPGWRASIVETAEELSGRAPGSLCWATAAALGGNGQRARISAIALARVAAFRQPSPAHGSDVIVGAMEECSLDPRPVLARARAMPVPTSTVLERAKHTMGALRQALRVASEAPECTPDEAADLKE